MLKNKQLTREMLESYGITQVTEDGRIFMGDVEVKQHTQTKIGKYKVQNSYKSIHIADKSQKIYNPKYGKNHYHYKYHILLVHRVVYAWHKGEIPQGIDIDHIDNNSLNNHLSNLRLLTRLENNNRKLASRNQYTYDLTDEELLNKRQNKITYYNRDLHRTILKPEFKVLYDKWHQLLDKQKELIIARREAKYKNKELWRQIGKQLVQNSFEINLIKLEIESKKEEYKNGFTK